MAEGMLAPLNWILGVVDKLLSEEEFNKKQQIFLLTIEKEAQSLHSLATEFAKEAQDKAKEDLSFHGRSHLASIIGYSEELLDEIEGELTDTQRDLLFEVRSSAKQLLEAIKRLSD